MPITWKNINANVGDGSAEARTGADLMSRSIDRLTQTAKDYSNSLTSTATDALLGQIASVSDMDQYNALRAQIAQNGVGNADTAQVWNALNSRDNDLRTDLTAQMNLDDKIRTEAERVANRPYLDQIASLKSIAEVDNFVKGLGSLEGSDINFGELVSAAETRRNALEGNVTFGNTQTTFKQGQDDRAKEEATAPLLGEIDSATTREALDAVRAKLTQANVEAAGGDWAKVSAALEQQAGDINRQTVSDVNTDTTVQTAGDEQLVREATPKLEQIIGTATDRNAADAQLLELVRDKPAGVQEQIRTDFENMWTAATGRTAEDQKQLQRQLEDVGDQMYEGDTSFNSAKVELDRRALKNTQLLNSIPEALRPDAKPMTPGDIMRQVQGNSGLDDDRFWSMFGEDWTAEDSDKVIAKAEDAIREVTKEFDGKTIPAGLILEAIKATPLNDISDGKGEIDSTALAKAAETALQTFTAANIAYNNWLEEDKKLAGENSALTRALTQATRSIEDQADIKADAKRLMR